MDQQQELVQDTELMQSKQLFNHPDYINDSKNRTVEQSPKTIETNNDAANCADKGRIGPNIFVIETSYDGVSNANIQDLNQPRLNFPEMPNATRESAAEINLMTMTDPGSIREGAFPTEDFDMPMEHRILVQPKKLVAIQANNFDFEQLRGHNQSNQKMQNINQGRLDGVIQLQQNVSQSTFPQGLRSSSTREEGLNSNRENKPSSLEPIRKSPKPNLHMKNETSPELQDLVLQMGIHGGDQGDLTKNTVIMDSACKSQLKQYSFPKLPDDLVNKDIKHSLTPYSPDIKEEGNSSSKSVLDHKQLTPNENRARYDGLESQKSSMAALPEYQLTGRFKQYAIISNKEDPTGNSIAAQTERGSNFAAVETESGEHIQGQDSTKPALQLAKKP